jgi:uncharacterized protein with GYD domain
MPKYLVEANYTHEGLKGLMHDKASGRLAALQKAAEGLGGKIETAYFTFGEKDVIVIMDLPDNASAAALALVASSTGLVRTKTTPLLTIQEVDNAIAKKVQYRAPGIEGVTSF